MKSIIIGQNSPLCTELQKSLKSSGHEVTVSKKRSNFSSAISSTSFDFCVDTSPKSLSDIRVIINQLKKNISHYILLSSFKVYPSTQRLVPWAPEDIDLCDESGFATVDMDVRQFRATERELRMIPSQQIPWTILRPAIIELKTHPEENNMWWFISRILDGNPIVLPDSDDPLFRHLSGEDLCKAICSIANQKQAFYKIMNITSRGLFTYDSYAYLLMKCLKREVPITRVPESLWLNAGLPAPMGRPLQSAFIDSSPLLTELGWQPSDEIDWVTENAKYLLKHPLSKPENRNVELALINPPPELGRKEIAKIADGVLVGNPGQPNSFRMLFDSQEITLSPPILKTVAITMGLAEEQFLLQPSDSNVCRVLGHNALLQLVEPGNTVLLPGSLYLPVAQRPCGFTGCSECSDENSELMGVDRDGFGGCFVSLSPEHLVPVPHELKNLALLADPLAALLSVLPPLLKESSDPIWIYGDRVDAVLAKFLIQDAEKKWIHINRSELTRKFQGENTPFTSVTHASNQVKEGKFERPAIAINLSGAQDGENLLVSSLAEGGTFITPFAQSKVRPKFQYLNLPLAAPGRSWLEQSLEQISSWLPKHNLSSLIKPLPLEDYWDVFIQGDYKQYYIDVAGDEK